MTETTYWARNREKVYAQQKEWRAKNRERLRLLNDKRHKSWSPEKRAEENRKRIDALNQERLEKPWSLLIKKAQCRAKQKKLPFDLTQEWGQAKWTGKCEITGIEFNLQNRHGTCLGFSPSIDRIVPKLGYTQGNCRFILYAVNTLRGCGSDDDVLKVAQAIVRCMTS